MVTVVSTKSYTELEKQSFSEASSYLSLPLGIRSEAKTIHEHVLNGQLILVVLAATCFWAWLFHIMRPEETKKTEKVTR